MLPSTWVPPKQEGQHMNGTHDYDSGREAVHTAQRRQADLCCLHRQGAAQQKLAHSSIVLELRLACVLLLGDEVCKQLLRPAHALDGRDVQVVPVKPHDPPAAQSQVTLLLMARRSEAEQQMLL